MGKVSLEMSASNNNSRICYNNHTNTHIHTHKQTSINTTHGANCQQKNVVLALESETGVGTGAVCATSWRHFSISFI